MKRAVVVAVVFAALTFGLLVCAMLSQYRYTAEVCVAYRGREACRQASGRSRDEAVRTAQDNACAFLASGMTDSVACQNTPPSRVTWIKE